MGGEMLAEVLLVVKVSPLRNGSLLKLMMVPLDSRTSQRASCSESWSFSTFTADSGTPNVNALMERIDPGLVTRDLRKFVHPIPKANASNAGKNIFFIIQTVLDAHQMELIPKCSRTRLHNQGTHPTHYQKSIT